MPRVTSACSPLAGSTSHSRTASSVSGDVDVYCTSTTGAPIIVTGRCNANIHVAAFGSLVDASSLRQPRYESGFCEMLAWDTGSVKMPTWLGPAVVVRATPRPLNDDH